MSGPVDTKLTCLFAASVRNRDYRDSVGLEYLREELKDSLSRRKVLENMRGKDTVDRLRWKIVQGVKIVDDFYTKLIPGQGRADEISRSRRRRILCSATGRCHIPMNSRNREHVFGRSSFSTAFWKAKFLGELVKLSEIN